MVEVKHRNRYDLRAAARQHALGQRLVYRVQHSLGGSLLGAQRGSRVHVVSSDTAPYQTDPKEGEELFDWLWQKNGLGPWLTHPGVALIRGTGSPQSRSHRDQPLER